MNTKPRLLFVIDEDLYFHKHRLDLARAAKNAGFEVLVATLVQQHGRLIEEEGFRLFPIRLRRGLQSPLHDVGALMQLVHLYRRERPHIVHHVALKQVMFGAIASRIDRVPIVVNAITGLGFLFHSHSRKATVLRACLKPVLRWALAHPRSAVIFENSEDCEDMVHAGLVTPSRAVVIHGAGVNVTRYRPSPEPSGLPVVLLASRMLWDKGIGEFIEAVRLLKRDGVSARFVLVGSIDKESPSAIPEDQVRRWEAEGIVEWWGHREDMPDVYASAHIVALPSYAEGLPMVLLEAGASGRPLIATRVRGCHDVVRHGENGFLVPVKDAPAIAKAVTRLLESPLLRQRLGMGARDIVVNEFSSEVVAEKTLALYRGLTAGCVRWRRP